MNWTYFRIELRRRLRDKVGVFFSAVLPAFFYIIFGASPDYGDESINDGNVAMWVMIGMAGYGAVTATTGVGGESAIERMQGWGRQLGLTPITDRTYIMVKTSVALAFGAVPVALIYAIGAFTGAEAPLWIWVASAAILLAGATIFALYGLDVGMAFRSESALGAIGGSLVVLSFLGNIFIPLSGWQLTVARFTPLYGYVALARWPLTGGGELDQETGELIETQLWQPVLNVAVWTLVFVGIALVLVPRGRERQ